MCTEPELVSGGNRHGNIKKKKKTRGKEDLNVIATQMSVNQLNEEESTESVPIDRRTLSNGLTIEELASGPPGGKVAVPGKKVSFFVGLIKKLLIMAAFMFDLSYVFFILIYCGSTKYGSDQTLLHWHVEGEWESF